MQGGVVQGGIVQGGVVQGGVVQGGQVQMQPMAVVPVVQQMDRFAGEAAIIEQSFFVGDLFGCEAKNVYKVYPGAKQGVHFTGAQSMYIREESGCVERLLCSVNRALTLHVHNGTDRSGPTMLQFHKPFHIQGCCCCRPSMAITDGAGQKLGRVDDPCLFNCMMEQNVYDHNDQHKYRVEGCCIQPGLCCPCCCDVTFDVKDVTGGPPGKITKIFNGCAEICCGMNRFKLIYPDAATDADKSLLLGSAMLIDLEYFEQNKNNE